MTLIDKNATIYHNGESIVLKVERNPRAKRMRLKIDRMSGMAVLVLTKRSSEKAGLAFAQSRVDWVVDQLSKLPQQRIFHDGMPLCFLGCDVVLHHSPLARRGVWLEENVVWVSGAEEHLARRARDFFKKEFGVYALEKVRSIAVQLGVKIQKVTIRDTTSRWGSCNRFGHISLSWRLSLAPLFVTDYVIAHEAAHLCEMNHSDAFWRTVQSVCPEYKKAELWLKKNAAYLYSFKG